MDQTASWKKWLVLFGVFFAILLPRTLDLDQYVTTDEVLWLQRSANFYYALGQREFEYTFQDKHPGVTVMWAGAAGFWVEFPEYRGMGQGYLTPLDFHDYLDKIGKEPLELLVASRFFIILGTTITLIIALLITSQLIGELPALIGFLFIAFDPFLIALNTILHPDAFLSSMMLLSSVSYIAYLTKEQKPIYLIISAAAAAGSWLTKYPGLFLIPYMGLITIIDITKKNPSWKNGIKRIIFPLILWFLISAVLFVVFWPSMWVAPGQTLSSIFNAFTSGFSSGNKMPVLLNGEIVTLANPNFSYYPLHTLWRSTPTVLLGLALAIIGIVSTFRGRSQARRVLSMLILFVLFYMLGLSLGSLKANRYIGAIFPFLDLMAVVGWIAFLDGFIGWLKGKYNLTNTNILQTVLAVVLITSQILLVVQTHPYYWAYYNPLLGGARKAVEVIDVGYGEGLDQAARYLEAQPNANELTVLSWYGTGPFSYYFSGGVLDMLIRSDWDSSNAKRIAKSDYVVTYVFQWQKGMTQELIETLSKTEPEYTVIINGAEYARLYRTVNIPPYDWEKLISLGK